MSLTFGAGASLDERFDCGTSVDFDTSATLTCFGWARNTEGAAGQQRCLMTSGNQTADFGIYMEGFGAPAVNRRLIFGHRDYSSGNAGFDSSTEVFNVDTWVFWACVDNGADVYPTGYRGTETTLATTLSKSYETKPAAGSTPSSNANTFYLGNNSAFNQAWEGQLGPTGIIKDALTQAEIRAIQFNPLVAARAIGGSNLAALWWPGIDGTSTLYDLSGNGNDGTATGTNFAGFTDPAGVNWLPGDPAFIPAVAGGGGPGGQPTMRRWGGVSNMNLVRPSIGRSW